MKFLYVTDLHGEKDRYRTTLELAMQCEVSLIVNGGDMLTTHNRLAEAQAYFIQHFLIDHFEACSKAGVRNLFIPGNDDLAFIDVFFDDMCALNPMIANLQRGSQSIEGWTFIGFNLVTDYPFRLKDRCRRDTQDFFLPLQLGGALVSKPNGQLKLLRDWSRRIAAMPTLEEELAKLAAPANPARTVYVIHMPPSQLGLDVCSDRRTVGSRAVLDFIERSGAPLSLHGHIHESPGISGIWHNTTGTTLCVQPGQNSPGNLTYVLVDTEKDPMVQRHVVECRHE